MSNGSRGGVLLCRMLSGGVVMYWLGMGAPEQLQLYENATGYTIEGLN